MKNMPVHGGGFQTAFSRNLIGSSGMEQWWASCHSLPSLLLPSLCTHTMAPHLSDTQTSPGATATLCTTPTLISEHKNKRVYWAQVIPFMNKKSAVSTNRGSSMRDVGSQGGGVSSVVSSYSHNMGLRQEETGPFHAGPMLLWSFLFHPTAPSLNTG